MAILVWEIAALKLKQKLKRPPCHLFGLKGHGRNSFKENNKKL
jgi:hypothetical protein